MKLHRQRFAGNADTFLSYLKDDHRAAIGQVITQWSMLETILENCIWQEARLRNDLGRSITSQMQMQSKLDLLSTLLHQPSLARKFKPVSEYIRECLVGPRNLVAHGAWFPVPATETIHVVKFHAKGRLTDQSRSLPIPDLTQLATDIADVTCWLMRLSEMLPKLKIRPGGLGHANPNTQNHQGCTIRKQTALRPPTLRLRAMGTPKKPKPQHRKSKN
jgi:hypothetical protein